MTSFEEKKVKMGEGQTGNHFCRNKDRKMVRRCAEAYRLLRSHNRWPPAVALAKRPNITGHDCSPDARGQLVIMRHGFHDCLTAGRRPCRHASLGSTSRQQQYHDLAENLLMLPC